MILFTFALNIYRFFVDAIGNLWDLADLHEGTLAPADSQRLIDGEKRVVTDGSRAA
jgi:hypothetical protein